jgi:hypothetical protein
LLTGRKYITCQALLCRVFFYSVRGFDWFSQWAGRPGCALLVVGGAGAGDLVKLGAGAVDSEAFAALALFP